MNKKVTFFLLIMLTITLAYSYLIMPTKFETEGGSCYQGITALIIRFFLTVCGVLNLLSIIAINYSYKIKTAKVLSVISLIIWLAGTFIHSFDNIIIGIKYFTPFLIFNILFVILIYKNDKSRIINNLSTSR